MLPDQIVVSPETVLIWARYRAAKQAKAQWMAEERDAKEALMLALGYEPGDPKPSPCHAVANDTGDTMFEVKVGERRGLDTMYLKREYPDIYASCEKVTHPISIQEVKGQ